MFPGMCSTADALAGKVRSPCPRKQSFLTDIFRKSSGVSAKEEEASVLEMRELNGEQADNLIRKEALCATESNVIRQRQSRRTNVSDNILRSTSNEGTEKPPDFSKDWKKIAEIFDRLFFWLFLLAIVISTLINHFSEKESLPTQL